MNRPRFYTAMRNVMISHYATFCLNPETKGASYKHHILFLHYVKVTRSQPAQNPCFTLRL